MTDIPVGDVLRSVVPPKSFFGKVLAFLKGMKFKVGGTTILLDQSPGAAPARTGLDQPSDFRSYRGPIKIGLLLALLLPAFLFAQDAPQGTAPLPVHVYNVLWHGSEEGASYRGTSIKSNGFCVEIQLNGRIDTVVCGVKLVTEAIEKPVDPLVRDSNETQEDGAAPLVARK